MKRMMVLSSLSSLIANQEEPDPAFIHKLNEILNLCHDEKAMLLPMRFKSVIWKSSKGSEMLPLKQLNSQKESDVTDAITELLARLPQWLRYDTDEKIASDIRTLCVHTPDLAKA
jgi:hypothetical protein